MEPFTEQIQKLPKWAQELIERLRRERKAAVNALNEYVDGQTPSPIWVDEYELTGENAGPVKKRRYIQTRRVSIEWLDVACDVFLASKGDNQRFPGIQFSWHSVGDQLGAVGLVPTSFGSMQLVAPKYLTRGTLK